MTVTLSKIIKHLEGKCRLRKSCNGCMLSTPTNWNTGKGTCYLVTLREMNERQVDRFL